MILGQWEYYYRELLWIDAEIAYKLNALIRNLIAENEQLKGIK